MLSIPREDLINITIDNQWEYKTRPNGFFISKSMVILGI